MASKVFQNTCCGHKAGLRRFSWHLPALKTSHYCTKWSESIFTQSKSSNVAPLGLINGVLKYKDESPLLLICFKTILEECMMLWS